MKKLITEATTEELLEIAKGTSDIELHVDTGNDVLDFISFYRLKKGPHLVTKQLLYKLYRQWSQTPLTAKTFSREMALFITTNKTTFSINVAECSILQQTLEKLKDKTKSKLYKTHFDNYLKKYNIKKGTFFVKDTVLYNLYDKWTYGIRKRNPLGIGNFNKFCKLYFKYVIKGRSYWFSIDKSIISHLSENDKNQLKGNTSDKETNKARQG